MPESLKRSRHGDNCSKKEEKSDDLVVDRISKLPESIISLILSLLPTITAVKTSVLSKSWRFLWTLSFNFDFRHRDYHYTPMVERERSTRFAQFVNRVLFHQKSAYINRFYLVWSCKFIFPSIFNKWMGVAMNRNVQELFVLVDKCDRPIQMPLENIFTGERLVSLQLLFCNISIPTMTVCLPRLECLKLASIRFQNEEAFQQVIVGCPRLKFLYIDLDVPGTPFKYVVSSASLARFVFNFRDKLSHSIGDGIDRYRLELEVEAPSLVFFSLAGPVYWISVRGSLDSLTDVYLSIPHKEQWDYRNPDSNYCNSIVSAIRAFNSAKTLVLPRHIIWALSCATIRLCSKFDRLKTLNATAVRHYGSSVQDLIQCSDNLQDLTLTMKSIIDANDLPILPSWRNPEDISMCLSNTLKTVSITNYEGSDEEFAMIGYMLQNGSVMELMEIFTTNQQVSLLQDVCALPRKSPTCKVEYRYL